MLDKGWMVVSPGENRHPQVTQQLHPKEVAGQQREGPPGVPRRVKPETQAASARAWHKK